MFSSLSLKLIPCRRVLRMDMLIKHMISIASPITHYPIKEYWLDIGRIDDYEKAQEIYKERFSGE
jgi:NDP-sugar pyrophosphorylase family protein